MKISYILLAAAGYFAYSQTQKLNAIEAERKRLAEQNRALQLQVKDLQQATPPSSAQVQQTKSVSGA